MKLLTSQSFIQWCVIKVTRITNYDNTNNKYVVTILLRCCGELNYYIKTKYSLTLNSLELGYSHNKFNLNERRTWNWPRFTWLPITFSLFWWFCLIWRGTAVVVINCCRSSQVHNRRDAEYNEKLTIKVNASSTSPFARSYQRKPLSPQSIIN